MISIRQNQDGQHFLVCDTQPLPGHARETFWLPIKGVPLLHWRTTKRTTGERWKDGVCTIFADEQRTTLVFTLDHGAAKVVINEVDTVNVRDDDYRACTTYATEPRLAWHYARATSHDLPLLPDAWPLLWEWSTNEWRMEDRTYRYDAAQAISTTKEHNP